jgi:hypothetical protein
LIPITVLLSKDFPINQNYETERHETDPESKGKEAPPPISS